MAILDQERNAVVLRIVYDGPAAAGKTTSVRSLALSLSRPMTTPEQAGERTLYFDWLDYTGGIFEGYQLRCQIVSVPGQAVLAHRRAQLIADADAVIYVAEVSQSAHRELLAALLTVQRDLVAASREAVGIVLQANKRDLPDALPIAVLREGLDSIGCRIGVVESTATTGAGIREAFVFAVRLALDRVREQIRAGSLVRGRPEIDSADALYRRMQTSEVTAPLEDAHASEDGHAPVRDEAGAHPLAEVLHEVVHGRAAAPETPVSVAMVRAQPPLAPDEAVPTGMIWPPIEGRLVLREAASEPPLVTRSDAGWVASSASGWRFHSPLSALFGDVEQGRAALVAWARLHAHHAALLSSPRCIALASDGAGSWRLWQVIRGRPSLKDRLLTMLDEHAPDRIAASLLDAASRLRELEERAKRIASRPLPLTLDTVGVVGTESLYVGLAPAGDGARTGGADAEMRTVVRDWSRRSGEIVDALLRARRGAREPDHPVIDGLVRLFGEQAQ